MFRNALILTVFGGFLAACGYEPARFLPAGKAVEMAGVIDAATVSALRESVEHDPSIDRIILFNVPGSVDDTASLGPLTRYIRDRGLATIVPAHGLVASGGTDMAVMGRRRIIEPGACIGVHSWAAGRFGVVLDTGAGLDRDAPEHRFYLDFYRAVGIPESFYWFTLQAAGPDDIHWMSNEEINRFGLSDIALPRSRETAQARADRCWQRLS